MARAISRSVGLFILVAGIAWMAVRVSTQAGQTGAAVPYLYTTAKGEWPSYNGDTRGSRYSPLDQVNAGNFKDLEIAWRFKTDNLGTRPEFKLEGTPLMVGGVLYGTGGTRRSVFALDAASGELLWVHGEHEGARAVAAPRQLSGRGLAYWTDGRQERILYYTPGYFLVALDAKTGTRVQSFGKDGLIDLKTDDDQEFMPDITTGEIGIHSAPTIAKDVVVVGAAFREGMTPKSYKNNKGYVRGYDVRTGKRLWIFHTIPKKGEPGYDTWLDGSAEYTGNTGVWTQISVDEENGLVYLPVESPTGDYYGGHRPGADLYGESLVCLDVKTGVKKWHYQLVHHPLWDYDISSAPLLMDINVNGRAIKAVAQPTKQSFLYVFDRLTGQPVWPIEERPVEKGTVPGEWYSPTQPFPTKPAAYARNGVFAEDLIDFTPELHDQAVQQLKRYKIGPIFTPPSVSTLDGTIATLTMATASGGTNWPGGSFDPETHTVYAYACNACLTAIGLVPPPSKDFSDMNFVAGTAGQTPTMRTGPGEGSGADVPQRGGRGGGGGAATAAGGAAGGRAAGGGAASAAGGGGRGGRGGAGAAAQAATTTPPAGAAAAPPQGAGRAGGGGGGTTVQGLPMMKPPYGTISAINVDRGEIVWQVAHGETPDNIRNSALLKGMNVPRTGQSGYNIGTLVTKTLVIAGDGQVTSPGDRQPGAMLRAYDKTTGKEVGAVWMPAQQSGSPMTYMVNGKQYIVVAVSGGAYSGEYIAFTLGR